MFETLWNLYQQGQIDDLREKSASGSVDHSCLRADLRELEFIIGRMALTQQAMWEILSQKHGATEAELIAKMNEIDLRDGVADGRITQLSGKKFCTCPSCGQQQSWRYAKCIYCGSAIPKAPITGFSAQQSNA